MSERKLRREIAGVCRRIYEKGFVAAKDGNVTARLDPGRILATPRGVSKGDVTAKITLLDDAFRKGEDSRRARARSPVTRSRGVL